MKSLESVAKELAQAHRAADPATTTIKRFSSPKYDEIRLLEVSTDSPTTGEILPFHFDEDREGGIDDPSVVILLSPEEWSWVENGTLTLPEGWDASSSQDL